MPVDSGTRLGRYEVRKPLGAGGMGEVYLAHDTQLGRRVALKTLPVDLASNQVRMHRFLQEAKAAATLNHPNIAHIYEVGEEAGLNFIVMEFIEGITLRERLAGGALRLSEILEVALQVTAALSSAHAAGIVHRDIKPENIMIRPDRYIKVLDFGLAKLIEADTSRVEMDAPTKPLFNTEPGLVIGTVTYMSPEQARGQTVDARTDIWSTGVVLYEMITGRTPFRGETTSDMIVSILEREPAPLAHYGTEAPTELEQIIHRALRKKREERYQTIEEMARSLKSLNQRLEFRTEEWPAPASAALTRGGGAPTSQPPATPVSQHHFSAEQRKYITVLFADLYGLTTIADERDAEETSDLMNALWERIGHVVSESGGRVDKPVGDAVMALWGVEAAREDDPERAIRAGLAMQTEVGKFVAANPRRFGGADARPATASQTETPALMRIGINTGPVLLGTAGASGGLTATGSTVSVASRLGQAAPVGGLIISHDTYRHVRGVFDVQELELQNVTARGEPAKTYMVHRAKPRAFRLGTRGVEGIETRMIGRKAELERLLDLLHMVLEDGELRAATLVGDAGLGKSRLLYEFSNEVELLPERLRIFYGRASEATRGLPYSLVRDVFSFRFEIQDSDPPEVARDKLEQGIIASSGMGDEASAHAHFIGHLIGLDFSASPHLRGILDDTKQIRDRAFHYGAQYFEAVARQAPVILHLEDLHWADDGSLDFVDHIARACGSVPMFVLCLTRPTLFERRPVWGEGQAAHLRLTLEPLSKRESRQLVEEILRRAETVPQALRELIVNGAEGNPFYVEELIKMLIDQRVIVPGADRWLVNASQLAEVKVPATLTGVLQARLDRLKPWEKAVLQRASVMGRIFWDSAVERLGTELRDEAHRGAFEVDPRAALEDLRRKELIYRREASSFAGTSEYIFKHALLRDVTYESVLKRERKAFHGAAARWLIEQSGGRVDEYAGTIALHYERAESSGLAAEWYGRAGQQAREAYVPEAAVNYYRRALALLADSTTPELRKEEWARSVEWYEGLGKVLWMQARFAEALEAYEQMRAVAEESGDVVAQARAWNGLASAQNSQGEYRASLESAQRSERLARKAGADPQARRALALALVRQSYALYRLGDAAMVMALAEQALELSTELGEEAGNERARSLKLLGMAQSLLGHFERAYSYKEQALVLFQELGNRPMVGNLLNSLGETARSRGDYVSAIRRYQDALAIAREIGDRNSQMTYLSNLGGAQIGLGDYRTAEANLREVISMTGTRAHHGLPETYRFLAEACLGQSKRAEALEAARAALSLARETEDQDHIGGAWRALALVAAHHTEPLTFDDRTYDAEMCFTESLRVFTAIGAEAERARTLCDWALYERERGNQSRAAEMQDEAREIFRRLGIKREA